MSGRSLNLALLIEESAGTRLLRRLRKHKQHNINYVLSSPSKSGAAGVSVWSVAQGLGLQTVPAKTIKDPEFGDRMLADEVDLLLSLRTPYIIPESSFAAPRLGAYNLHTGPLPHYAGRNVINWALYNGEASHGVTLHEVSSSIDGGSIAYQACFPIAPELTALQLTNQCINEGLALVDRLIEQAALDATRIPSVEQNPDHRTYYGPDIPEEGRVRWNQPAQSIENFVRACNYYPFPSPWGNPQCVLSGHRATLIEALATTDPVDADTPPGAIGTLCDNGLRVACADRWLLIKSVFHGEDAVAPISLWRLDADSGQLQASVS